ncbi:acyl-CoA thioesterase [Ligilactobacillus acidipiscis]|uniref:acyl-CoA thioesterase n=1 Tax=Ligilactobacillus acidipiscis TaxID=89059 RepID=UPI0029F6289D|nr:acyl-CoA thioesterase [Ligilactobacillus acidipiscis]MCI1954689.1 acyl-CoA thioesterase [Ligilactobacillus acidipiscis]
MKPYFHKVQYYETDQMQITSHTNYIRFMEEARSDYLEQIGWPYDKLERAGVTSPVVNVNCKYKKTTSYPDLIKITTTISKISRVKLTLKYTMKVADELVCSAESSHCFLDGNGRIIDLKTKMPEFYATLQELNQK